MKRLALIGSKEFAEQIQGFAEATGQFVVVGYFDDYEEKGTIIRSLPVLGGINDIESEYQKGSFDCVFLAAGYNNFIFRENTFNKLSPTVPFANILSPSATIGRNVIIGQGVFVGDHTYIDDKSIIEDNVFIHVGSTIGHNNIIGAHTYISGRFDTCGDVKVGKRCFIGVRCLVSDHVSICDDSWIGIGSVVLKNITEPGKYMPISRLIRVE